VWTVRPRRPIADTKNLVRTFAGSAPSLRARDQEYRRINVGDSTREEGPMTRLRALLFSVCMTIALLVAAVPALVHPPDPC
jgi:hypothetical protein